MGRNNCSISNTDRCIGKDLLMYKDKSICQRSEVDQVPFRKCRDFLGYECIDWGGSLTKFTLNYGGFPCGELNSVS